MSPKWQNITTVTKPAPALKISRGCKTVMNPTFLLGGPDYTTVTFLKRHNCWASPGLREASTHGWNMCFLISTFIFIVELNYLSYLKGFSFPCWHRFPALMREEWGQFLVYDLSSCNWLLDTKNPLILFLDSFLKTILQLLAVIAVTTYSLVPQEELSSAVRSCLAKGD